MPFSWLAQFDACAPTPELILIESFVAATVVVLGERRAGEIAVEMASRLASGAFAETQDERAASLAASDIFVTRMLPILVPRPRR